MSPASVQAPLLRASLLPWVPGLEVVHHLPGRIRVQLSGPAPQQSGSAPLDLDELVRRLPGVRSVRLNILAASAVVEYDPARLPPSALERFFASPDAETAGACFDLLFPDLSSGA